MYPGVRKILKTYWIAYGGTGALARSPYLHFAVIGVVLTSHFWLTDKWWDQVLGVIPNLLGFTLGGFALFLGFGDDRFRTILAQPDNDSPEEPTFYIQLCSTFVHFICVQTIALVFAVLAKAWDFHVCWPDPIGTAVLWSSRLGGAIGYGFFLYSITSILAATLHVFRIATIYEAHKKLDGSNTDSDH